MLLGEKVELDPMVKSIIPNLLKWFNDPEVVKYLAMYLPMMEEGEEEWLRGLSTTCKNSDIVFIMNLIRDGNKTPIGTCGIHKIDWKNRDAELGMAIGEKDYWGKGCGTEVLRLLVRYAFKELNLHRVSSRVYLFNERSMKMNRKVGLSQEGTIRQGVFKNGKYWDVAIFGLLREEWADNS